MVVGAGDSRRRSIKSGESISSASWWSLATPPDYVLRPRYQTREQNKLMAMEGQISDLTVFLKGMQARIDDQHDAVKKTLEANTAVLQDLSVWKPKVQADADEL